MDVQEAVRERYTQGAKRVEAELCCPVDYDRDLLAALPQEIIDKDYGCGDPSRYVQPGDTVLDLGSGGGKICYMAAQLVGPRGQVIGVDTNDDMLALARRYQPQMSEQLGVPVAFFKGRIQDLALDLEAADAYLTAYPVTSTADLAAFEAWQQETRRERPMIPDNSVDLVISNCVLNLVDDAEKTRLIQEIHRVLKPGGRVAISDIVSDEPIPSTLKQDPQLWSGCLAGAFQEQAFLAAFREAGLQAVSYDKWQPEPWRVVDGIEFRSVTLSATKGDNGPCLDYGHAVIYRGPFAQVTDDEDHIFPRGQRMAVCERTYRFLTEGPLKDHFIGIPPNDSREPVTWCAAPGTQRPAAETKRAAHTSSASGEGCC